MKGAWTLLLLVGAVLLTAAGGCPLSTPDEQSRLPLPSGSSVGGTGGPPAPGGSTAGPTGGLQGTTDTVDAVEDEFSVDFPGCQDPAEGTFWKAEVLRLVNVERAARSIDAVAWSPVLAEQATQYACEMIFYNFFDHANPVTGSELRDRAAEFEYDFWIIGENLAAGQRSPVEVVNDWMDSPCHRENLLNPAFTELGIGIRYGGRYGYYWVQEFGRPFSSDPYLGEPYSDPECDHGE